MPKIYDNIQNRLHIGLLDSLATSWKADFCVGYFNLRGWGILNENIDHFNGKDECCRLLVGMQRPEEDLLKLALSNINEGLMDNPKALAIRKDIARSFRKQLTLGIPNNQDEKTLQKLKHQLIDEKVKVKLFLGHPLHAKLYLLHRTDKVSPLIGFVGSSNLTMSGLSSQGELNVDVLDQDAALKLQNWFDDRWNDRWCIDITKELIEIIEESWAAEKLIPPYYVYLKIAYHLSQEARSGINNYIIPKILKDELLPYQSSAVSLAARHLDKRNGVLIGDVVGLGKTLTATAVAKLFEETFFTETLIICPKNLVRMWDQYVHTYQLRGKVISISKINKSFIDQMPRFRVVIIDESHNLRNRQGKKYAFVKEYIDKNESKVILLTATPYNKTYLDISNQLRLFIPEDRDLGFSPERFVASVGGPIEFMAKYQYSPNTLLAFEKSGFSEDWQELLKIFMVRRTRTFIKNSYATYDEERDQHYITFNNGQINYFPTRLPKRVEYSFDETDPSDIYVKLYSPDVVAVINRLHLSRYGLGNFIDPSQQFATDAEEIIISNLSRAGKRLMGFCRTNLFKRLESSGFSFLISLARHISRNCMFIYAIEQNLPLPIGQQEAAIMDEYLEEEEFDTEDEHAGHIVIQADIDSYKEIAKRHYHKCEQDAAKYKWISSSLFTADLLNFLIDDVDRMLSILTIGHQWNPNEDKQLNAFVDLCLLKHPTEKILLFTQFADTARYLSEQLGKRGVSDCALVTGQTENPTEYAIRFSPKSNKSNLNKSEIRVLITTDVLSEGQNLQDAHIVVNYDLPWALIRLIQRAGRVDRIGQESPAITCYSFLPHDGLERIIGLRNRLTQRITQNAEIVGADETFFDGDPVNITDLYNEKSGILDDDDGEVDLTSQAYEIWNQAIKANPELKKKIPALPNVVYSTKEKAPEMVEGESVIAYHQNSQGYEMLTWLNADNKVISQSQSRILKAAECSMEETALPKLDNHHFLVKKAVELGEEEAKKSGGQLGNQSSARYKSYGIIKRYYESIKNSLFDTEGLKRTIDDIFKYPLRESARELINRRIRLGVSDEELSVVLMQLREEGRLSVIENKRDDDIASPQIICSLGIKLT
ncbi:MAG: DEAD/DEAH box helicase [Mucilaginibacter sp.]